MKNGSFQKAALSRGKACFVKTSKTISGTGEKDIRNFFFFGVGLRNKNLIF